MKRSSALRLLMAGAVAVGLALGVRASADDDRSGGDDDGIGRPPSGQVGHHHHGGGDDDGGGGGHHTPPPPKTNPPPPPTTTPPPPPPPPPPTTPPPPPPPPPPPASPPPPPPAPTVTYTKTIAPDLAKCAVCHQPTGIQPNPDLSTYAGAMANASRAASAVVGNMQSYAGFTNAQAAQVQADLNAWIAAGYPQ